MADDTSNLNRLEAKIEGITQQLALMRDGVVKDLAQIQREMERQEQRTKDAIAANDSRATERITTIATALQVQATDMRTALREDRQQWIDAMEKQHKQVVEMVAVVDKKYEDLPKLRERLLMILGGLILLGVLAKPFLDKLLGLGKP